MDFLSSIRNNIDNHGLLPEEKQLIVAVSGGADSVALLHAFKTLELPCSIAHVNHGLRGHESDADELFVRELARKLEIPFHSTAVDVGKLATQSSDSIEMAARKARHTFFETFDKAVIALAHHADDQVETFLLRLARGAGPEGLSGMSFSSEIGPLKLIRPMLDIPRAEIIHWLKENGYTWREDSSNSEDTFLRNRIRNSILPMLEKELNPAIRHSVIRTMDILRAENEWMNEQIRDLSFDSPADPAAKRRLLRNWLFKNGVEQVSFDAIEKILELMDAGQGTSIFELNELQRVVIEYGTPRLENLNSLAQQPEWTLTAEAHTGWEKDLSSLGQLPATAAFCAKKVGDASFEVRCARNGDRMRPMGMDGSRKLQDIFTDLKIPRSERNHLPVVVCREEIIWVPGYRISRDWTVPDQSAPSILVHIEQKRTI